MAKFRLLATHYIDNQLLEAGTLVGEGTSFPNAHPTLSMEGVDAPSAKAIEKLRTAMNVSNGSDIPGFMVEEMIRPAPVPVDNVAIDSVVMPERTLLGNDGIPVFPQGGQPSA